MAVKWAVANGNWNAGATWNDGTIPQIGDYVYANGKTIQIDTGVDIGNGTLSNEVCPATNIAGGTFSTSSTTVNITANLRGYNYSYVVTYTIPADPVSFALIGNIYNFGITLSATAKVVPVYITGNISGYFLRDTYTANSPSTKNIYVTGNLSEDAVYVSVTNKNSINLYVVGNVRLNKNTSSPYDRLARLDITGRLTFLESYVASRPIYIAGVLDLSLTDLTYIPTTSSIIFAGQTTIVADYPAENVVKEGVRYGVGLVGTYQQPPEAVVLKGYVYDNGDKTGILETTNISQQLISRLENCATIETVQQLLVAHLDD